VLSETASFSSGCNVSTWREYVSKRSTRQRLKTNLLKHFVALAGMKLRVLLRQPHKRRQVQVLQNSHQQPLETTLQSLRNGRFGWLRMLKGQSLRDKGFAANECADDTEAVALWATRGEKFLARPNDASLP
jgi:hypothetical protein